MQGIDREIEEQTMRLEKLLRERDGLRRQNSEDAIDQDVRKAQFGAGGTLGAGAASLMGLQGANKRLDQWRSPDYVRSIVSYHNPTPDSLARIGAVRTATEMFIRAIAEQCPDNADRAAAIRHAREAMMTANASIVLEDLA